MRGCDACLGRQHRGSNNPEQPTLSAPEKLRADHELSAFECGEPALDDWLRKRALQNEESGASRTYVVCAGHQVAGYYALAVGAVAHAHASGRVRRNMPDPVPVMVVGAWQFTRTIKGKRSGQVCYGMPCCAPCRPLISLASARS